MEYWLVTSQAANYTIIELTSLCNEPTYNNPLSQNIISITNDIIMSMIYVITFFTFC